LTCAVLLRATTALQDANDVHENFYDKYKCFQNDEGGPFRLHGQETPLSSTLDNFVALVEKFEAANSAIDLKYELEYFIQEYLYENIQITNGGISDIASGRISFQKIRDLWKEEGYRPEIIDPFTDEEKCSLYFLISHSSLVEDTIRMRSYTNESIFSKTDLNSEDYYPQEIGVVDVRGSGGPVALGKVLVGMYVGLKDDRKAQLKTFQIQSKNVSTEILDSFVDTLYAATMADVLMASSFDGFERFGLTKDGKWVSVPLSNTISGTGQGMEEFCPMVYKHNEVESVKQLPAFSYASVRGAADGLILGLAVKSIVQSGSGDSRLSVILRTYYSPRGIILNEQIEDMILIQQVSVCKRAEVIDTLEPFIKEQLLPYGYLVSAIANEITKANVKSNTVFEDIKKDVLYNRNGNDYCAQATSLDKPEDLTAETFLDILVVLDTSNTQKNFIDQQLIIGYLAKQLDLRYYGSRMTVLLDQSITSQSGSSSRVELKPVVVDTYSTSCAACIVAQLNYERSTEPREKVISAIDQLLQERKDNETAFSGVNGKVVIYFNYEDGEGRATNNRVQDNVDKALRNFNLRHPDVVFYAVGLDGDILKKYAKDDRSLVILGSGDKPKQVADQIFKKIVYAPALLQFANCMDGKNEKSATFETFVSPNKIQHYTMPAKYFYKSFNIKILFESQEGQVRVCYNRATPKPENLSKYCKESSQGAPAEFTVSNPCKSFTKESCSPMNFAVIGKDPLVETNGNRVAQRQRATCKTNDRMCSALDQIKFKISHEGIRCSGCLGLTAPPVVILLTVLLSYFLQRKL